MLSLPLPDAQLLAAQANLELKIIETAPPFVSKTRVPVWGEWRVLRARQTENLLELLVARELIAEEHVEKPAR